MRDSLASSGYEQRPPNPGTLHSIQYLRGLAAVAVAAMHTGWTYSGIGAAGVDVFFVISGFIMVYVSGREPSPLMFLRARAARVIPLYWLTTMVALVVRRDSSVSRVLASLVFWPHVGFDGHDYPVVIQGWTLNYEAFFYVAFALSLLLSSASRLIVLTMVFSGLVLLGLVVNPTHIAAQVYTNPLLFEFLAGAWLCQTWKRGWLPTGRVAWIIGALGVIAFALQVKIELVDNWRWLVWGTPSLLVVAGALGVEGGKELPRVPGLLVVGSSSYALYLTHLLVERPLLPVLRPLPMPLALSLMLAACIGVAIAVHAGIEKPLAWIFRPAPRRLAVAGAD